MIMRLEVMQLLPLASNIPKRAFWARLVVAYLGNPLAPGIYATDIFACIPVRRE